ncbi:hypothetical protein VTK26DRAFT_5660 [Humicola hyalothermophila]
MGWKGCGVPNRGAAWPIASNRRPSPATPRAATHVSVEPELGAGSFSFQVVLEKPNRRIRRGPPPPCNPQIHMRPPGFLWGPEFWWTKETRPKKVPRKGPFLAACSLSIRDATSPQSQPEKERETSKLLCLPLTGSYGHGSLDPSWLGPKVDPAQAWPKEKAKTEHHEETVPRQWMRVTACVLRRAEY